MEGGVPKLELVLPESLVEQFRFIGRQIDDPPRLPVRETSYVKEELKLKQAETETVSTAPAGGGLRESVILWLKAQTPETLALSGAKLAAKFTADTGQAVTGQYVNRLKSEVNA